MKNNNQKKIDICNYHWMPLCEKCMLLWFDDDPKMEKGKIVLQNRSPAWSYRFAAVSGDQTVDDINPAFPLKGFIGVPLRRSFKGSIGGLGFRV